MKNLSRIALLLAGLTGSAWAQEGGVMLRDEVMRASAAVSGASVANVARGASVEILASQAGWLQVRHSGKTGWVRLLSVRKGEAARTSGDLAGVVSLGTTRADPSRVTATAGLRGLTEQELRAARFDPAELKRLDSYAVAESEARQFAAAAELRAVQLGYLPAPKTAEKKAPAGSAPGGGFDFLGGQ